jgi:hypothetical protein
MSNQSHDQDPISPWFIAAEELGEYIGIRFGHVPSKNSEPEWIFLRHTEVDGIGGLAQILRSRGADLPRLAQVKHPSAPSWGCLLRASPKFLAPRRRVKWGPIDRGALSSNPSGPPVAVGWHIFDETATLQIRKACRRIGVTVNSFLLKHLTKAIRPSLQDHSSMVPWMVPVNLRGKVTRAKDTDNHSSYVSVNIQSYETVHDIHRNIYGALQRGEHWANWYGYKLGRFSTSGMKKFLLVTERAMSQWHLGGFSNLGDWDPEKKLPRSVADGAWLFTPPVLRCQLVGAGCVTFQNKLSITIQAHPDLTTNPDVPKGWVQEWVKEIDLDLASVVAEVAAAPSLAA